jgi:hypothetical protein
MDLKEGKIKKKTVRVVLYISDSSEDEDESE